MNKVVLEFVAKVEGERFKFPMLSKRHVVEGIQGNGRVMSYRNSNFFDDILNHHLRKELGLPVGLHCWLGDVLPVNPCMTVVKAGFFYMFRIEFEDAR